MTNCSLCAAGSFAGDFFCRNVLPACRKGSGRMHCCIIEEKVVILDNATIVTVTMLRASLMRYCYGDIMIEF